MDNGSISPGKYTYLVAQKFAYAALIVGAVAWLVVGAFNTNPVTAIFGEGLVSRLLFILVGAAGLFFILRRDYYLPFLGEAVMPCGALQNRTPPGATRSITVSVEPGAKVLYWASEPATAELAHINDWRVAYARFENAGVTTADADGTAVLRVREPQAYSVPFKGRLEPHVHYRVCADGGMIGRVHTVYTGPARAASMAPMTGPRGSYDMEGVEGFENPGGISEEKAAQAKRMLQTMGQAVPQINQILSNIQTQFSAHMDGTAATDEGGAAAQAADIQEAFRVY